MIRPRIVVLGGGGFIGRRIVRRLLDSGQFQPVAAGRHVAATDHGGAECSTVDACDAAALHTALRGADAVVSAIAGSAAIIRASAETLFRVSSEFAQPPRVVYLSSMAAYGSASGRVDENTPLRGDLGDYSAAKAHAEQLAARYEGAVRLRPGIVYGPESEWWSDRIARLLVARRLGDLGEAGDGICNLVHVDDVAVAVERTLQVAACANQAYNLGSPLPPTWNEYFRRYALALGAQPLRSLQPLRLAAELSLAGPILKLLETLSPRHTQLPTPIRPWLIRLTGQKLRLDVRQAERALGLSWTPLDAGLRQTADWFLQRRRAPQR